jgi:hypothetical protein
MIMNFDDAETESLIYVLVVFLSIYSEGRERIEVSFFKVHS